MIRKFSSIIELVAAFPTEQSCIEQLEGVRWAGIPISPFNAESKVYKCAGNKYRCKETGKYFNVRTGTMFDNTKIPLQKWFLALYVFSSHKKGISSYQLAKDIGITQKSAWFLLHRLRSAFDLPAAPLSNIVEIDEAYIGGKVSNKHESKKERNYTGNPLTDQQPVLGMRERGGNIIAKVIDTKEKQHILPAIKENVSRLSIVMTDEYSAYRDLKKDHYHFKVNHSAKEYVNGMAHTNGIENFWSHLKRGLEGIYHWASKRHLQAYVDEFVMRFNTRKMGTQERFDLILTSAANRKLPYQKLVR